MQKVWNRKSCVCHVCGKETNRFADHILRHHQLADYETERPIRDERHHLVILQSFVKKSVMQRELDDIEESTDGRYSLDAIIAWVTTRGYVVTIDEPEGQPQVAPAAAKTSRGVSTAAGCPPTSAAAPRRAKSGAVTTANAPQPAAGNIFNYFLVQLSQLSSFA